MALISSFLKIDARLPHRSRAVSSIALLFVLYRENDTDERRRTMPESMQKKTEVLVCVAVLIRHGDRVLLNRRRNNRGAGSWAPIVGHMQYGETPEQCAIRETREETGVEIGNVKFRVITNDVFQAEHEHYITIWMESNYVSGKPHVNAPDEESDVQWFFWHSLPQPLFLSLQHVLDGQTYPSQATQDKVGAAIENPQPLHYEQ
jgi:8-oxo-dGTP diphosphatase